MILRRLKLYVRRNEFTTFVKEVSGKNWAMTNVDQLLKKINSTGMTERLKGSGTGHVRSVHTSKFWHTSKLWRSSCHEIALHAHVCTKLKGRREFCGRLGALQSTILTLKIYSACQGYCQAPSYFPEKFQINYKLK